MATKEQANKWKPIMEHAFRRARDAKDISVGLRLLSEHALNDSEFLDHWMEEVQTYDEPIRSRATSFLRRLKSRKGPWNFDVEFRTSFN